MINNNQEKNTNISTGTKSESNIYLKKSELPKNVSSFKNDAKYISESALTVWLKEHSYLSKNEIDTLIRNANLVVIDSINKEYDEEAIGILSNKINDLSGEIVAIKDRLNDINGSYISIDKEGDFATKADIISINNRINSIDTSEFITIDDIPSLPEGLVTQEWVESQGYIKTLPDLSIYAKKSQLNDYATKNWVNEQGFLTEHQDISGLATKSELSDYAKISILKDYAKKSSIPDISGLARIEDIPSVEGLVSQDDLNDYATKSQLEGYVKTNTLNRYVKKSELPNISNIATKDDIPSVEGLVSQDDLSDYATKNQLNDYVKTNTLNRYVQKTDLNVLASKEWVSDNFLTEHQDLSDYAKKSELPNLSGYVKSSALSNYTKKSEVYTKNETDNKFLSKNDAKDIYLSKQDAKDEYMTIKDVNKDFLKIEDYMGLKDATVISDEYKDKTMDEFNNILNTSYLKNGFYIVHYNDIVIVKDNSPINIFEGGAPQSIIEWKEED